MGNALEGNMGKPEPKKIVQSEEVVQAVAKMDEILAKNKKGPRFKLTPEMIIGAKMKAHHERKIENLDDD